MIVESSPGTCKKFANKIISLTLISHAKLF
jgi:hypothetical protein